MSGKKVKMVSNVRQYIGDRMFKSGEFFEVDSVDEAKELEATNYATRVAEPKQDKKAEADIAPVSTKTVEPEAAEVEPIEEKKHDDKTHYKTREMKAKK